MRKFAGAVIRFLRECYDDAYEYNLTINQGAPFQKCLTLDVKSNHLTIHITEDQMFHLYELYWNNDNAWQEQLQDLIEE